MSLTREISIRMRQGLALIRGGIMDMLVFRTSMLVSVIGNVIYLIIIYFLWKAIFASSPTDTVNGMTFYDTMVYLVLAAAIFNILNTYVVWDIGRSYQSGELVEFLIKPMDYQIYMFFAHAGNCVVSLGTTFLPTLIIVFIATRGTLALGMNLLMFFVSLFLAMLVSFCVDFFVGTICIYTQSIWGVNAMKEVIVSLLSGATIPLAFFPEKFRMVVDYLPFRAIYHTPLNILTSRTMGMADYGRELGIQLVWVVLTYLASKLFWKYSMKNLTVNGG